MAETQRVRLPVLQQSAPAMLDAPLLLPEAPVVPADIVLIDRASLRLDERTTLRTSSYTIYVDLPGNAEEMLLVHGYTGAFDKVSRRVATYLRSLEIGRPPKPLYGVWSPEPAVEGVVTPPSEEAIQKLKKRGHLTTMSEAEEEAFFTKLASHIHHMAVRQSPGYILVPTYQCNLRCHYCFQDHMRTDPAYRHILRLMDEATVDRLFEGMRHIEAAHGHEAGAPIARTITLFGGEPLLEESRPIIEYIIRRAKSLGEARFSAISNATDLHAYRDLLGPDGIARIQVTIDGTPVEHDRRRIYPDGSGSFERIAANITMALERGTIVSTRMNIDRNNLHTLPEIAGEFIDRGWTQHPGFSSYVAPIHATNEHTDEDATLNSWQLSKALEEMKTRDERLRVIGCNDDRLLSRARAIFEKRADPLPGFRTEFCGAHATMYVLDAFGDVYACWERLGDPSLRIGHIDASGNIMMNRALMDTWRSRSVVSNPVCRKCRYATYCGGGCAVLAEEEHGDMHKNHCDGFAKRFRASAATAYMDHVSGASVAVDVGRVCDM